jgi:putative membrane protein
MTSTISSCVLCAVFTGVTMTIVMQAHAQNTGSANTSRGAATAPASGERATPPDLAPSSNPTREIGDVQKNSHREPGNITPTSPPETKQIPPATTVEDYVAKVSMGDMLEIESSKLALAKAKDQRIRDFANRMVADHTSSTQTLQDILQKEKLRAPLAKQLDTEKADKLARLKSAEGAAFDELYADMQVAAHNEALALHQQFSQSGPNKALADFATLTAATVRSHRSMISDLRRSMPIR